jgi:hypothetical protein
MGQKVPAGNTWQTMASVAITEDGVAGQQTEYE